MCHQPSFSITSSVTSSLPQTCWTSSSSSSTSSSLNNVAASSSSTSTIVCGRQASLALSGSPSTGSSARATSWSDSCAVQISWPSSLDATSSAPASSAASNRDRQSVVKGKSVSVRVDLGGRRLIKKKTPSIIPSTDENYNSES